MTTFSPHIIQPNQQYGAGFVDVARKVHGFVKRNKLISRVGAALGAAGVPGAAQVGSVAGALGYGRRRRRRVAGGARKTRRARGGAMKGRGLIAV